MPQKSWAGPANGEYCNFKIVEIPDNTEYKIIEKGLYGYGVGPEEIKIYHPSSEGDIKHE